MNNEISQRTLSEAYKIVQNDLLNNFQKMKDQQVLRLPSIGVFEKKFKKGKSTLPTSLGKKYETYWMAFRMSKVLKNALNK